MFRITPAYAGNTHSLTANFSQLRDHPRLRGEHKIQAEEMKPKAGSPPPTRGTLPKRLSRLVRCGITPAYAGNTQYSPLSSQTLEDHPRLRGEHAEKEIREQRGQGSPPPTRGTRLVQVSEKGGERITPAYAGNTSISSMLLNLLGDHPRLRGEHV